MLNMVFEGRPLPEEIHLQLDNTTSENKTLVMFLFAGWLVENKWCTRVRIFFLGKGHTHVIIDQAFGAVTKFIRSNFILHVYGLMNAIRKVCGTSSKYCLKECSQLHHVFDWWKFFEGKSENLGGFATGNWTGDGYHDFFVTADADNHALLNMRKYAATAHFESAAGAGFRLFKDHAPGPDAVPPIADFKGDDAWDRDTVAATIIEYEAYLGLSLEDVAEYKKNWQAIFVDTASCAASLLPKNVFKFRPLSFNPVMPSDRDRFHANTSGTSIPPEFAYLYDNVSNPAVCTVYGGHRTQTQVAKDIAHFLEHVRGTRARSATEYPGFAVHPSDFQLVRHGGSIVLLRVKCQVQKHKPVSDPDLHWRGTLYEAAEASATPLLGLFKRRTDVVITVNRSDVLVYCCTFLKVSKKSGISGLHFDLQTLETLAAEAEDFSLPVPLPRKYEADAPAPAPKPRPARKARNRQEEDEDKESELEVSEDSSSDDEESEGEDKEEDPEEEVVEEAADPDGEVRREDSFALRGARKVGDLVWVNILGSKDAKGHAFPIGLAECRSIEANGRVTIAWWFTTGWKDLSFVYSAGNFGKFWQVTDGKYWWREESIATSSILPIKVSCEKKTVEKVKISREYVDAICTFCLRSGVTKAAHDAVVKETAEDVRRTKAKCVAEREGGGGGSGSKATKAAKAVPPSAQKAAPAPTAKTVPAPAPKAAKTVPAPAQKPAKTVPAPKPAKTKRPGKADSSKGSKKQR